MFRELSKKTDVTTSYKVINVHVNKSEIVVDVGDEMSSQFGVVNGIKQGGILYCLIFVVNIDGLLVKLEETGEGCHMGIHSIGALVFADDLNMLTLTLSGLKIVIDVCEKYDNEFNIKFNGSKIIYFYLREGSVRF